MNEEMLQELVVKLIGDPKQYVGMLKEVEKKTDETAKRVMSAGTVIESVQGKIEGLGSTLLRAAGALGVSIGFWKSFEMAEKAEENIIRMNAAIEQHGGDVAALTARYSAFAKAMSDVTTMSKGEVLALLRRAETMGISGDAAERVTRGAIGLAGATDMSAEAAMRVSMAVEQGNPRMLMRVEALRRFRSDTERMTEAQRLMNLGMRVQEQLAETVSGRITRMQNSMKALSKEVGALIADGIRPVVEWLQKAANWFNSLDPTVRRVTAGVLAAAAALLVLGPLVSTIAAAAGPLLIGFKVVAVLVAGVFTLAFIKFIAIAAVVVTAVSAVVQALGGFEAVWGAIKGAAVEAWIAIQFGLQNFQRLSQFVFLFAQLRALQAFEEIKHFFTTTFPELTTWFLSHWHEVLTDFVNLGMTMVGNLSSNIVNIISSIPDLISGATNWENVWRPLTDGFQSAISEFPNLTARQIGEVEEQLRQQYAREQLAISQSFDQFRHQQLAAMNQAAGEAGRSGEAIGAALDRGFKKATNIQAAIFGSAEALSRIAASQARFGAPAAPGAGGPTTARPRAPGEGGGFNLLATMDTVFNRLRDRLVEIATNAWNAVTEWAIGIWTSIRDWAVDTWNGIGTAAAEVWDNIVNYAFQKWDEIKQWAFDIFDEIDANVAWFIDHWPEIAQQAWDDISQMAQDAWDAVVEFWDNLPDTIANVWTTITTGFTSLWNSVPTLAKQAWDAVVRFASDAWNEVVATVQQLIGRVTGSQTVQAIGRQISNVTSGNSPEIPFLRDIRNGISAIAARPQTVLEGLGLPGL